jgi:hypothetical protein
VRYLERLHVRISDHSDSGAIGTFHLPISRVPGIPSLLIDRERRLDFPFCAIDALLARRVLTEPSIENRRAEFGYGTCWPSFLVQTAAGRQVPLLISALRVVTIPSTKALRGTSLGNSRKRNTTNSARRAATSRLHTMSRKFPATVEAI